MKKVLVFAIMAVVASSVFVSCKKGENDPMSLKSRKSRIAGEWKLTAGTETYTSSSGTTTTTTWDGTNTTADKSSRLRHPWLYRNT
jgi:hypothetical protein